MSEIYKAVKQELMPIFLKIFQKIEEERTLLNSFCGASITLILKPDTTRKENYKPASQVNIDAKILSKILVN